MLQYLLNSCLFLIVLFIFQLPAQAEMSPQKVNEIDQVVQKLDANNLFEGVNFIPTNDLKGPAISFNLNQEPTIKVNPKILAMLPLYGQTFILFHELGHIHLKHIYMDYPGPEAAMKYEIEADVFASQLFLRTEAEDQIKELLAWLASEKDSHMVKERFVECEKLLLGAMD